MFIVLEGIDGSGKTYSGKKLVNILQEYGYDTVFTYEPYHAKALNNYATEHNLSQEFVLGLMVADRTYHVENVIQPALDAGKIVICDRYYYSNLAYQGYGGGIDLDLIYKLNAIATKGIEPDIVFYIKISQERARKNRIERDGDNPTNMEFLDKVAKGYQELAKKHNFVVINADKYWDAKEDIMADYVIKMLEGD